MSTGLPLYLGVPGRLAVGAPDSGAATSPEGPRLLGFFHPAPPDRARDTAVLLVNPIGWEAIAIQRTYRALAEAVSDAGHPALRFDLDGAGDSLGDDTDPGRLDAWVESVVLAAAELRQQSAATRLVLIGVHLGGTLAALAAARLATTSLPVDGLVLWNAFAKGKPFVRQVRAYRALNAVRPGVPEGGEEAAGFLLTPETVTALSAIDLATLPSAPPSEVLLLHAPEGAGAAEVSLAQAFSMHGANVRQAPVAGYAEMMQEPRKTVVPTALIERVTGWLQTHFATTAAATASPVPREDMLRGTHFIERWSVHWNRFGIITRPLYPAPGRPAVVFLNTASDPRTGPNRMYVRWARALATAGFISVRFDPSGIGDSPVSPETGAGMVYSSQRLDDARAVVDWLAAEGIARRVVLVGLCSGAYVAFHLGREDPRVVGELLINPQTFFWREGDSLDIKMRQSFKSSRFYRDAVLQWETWKRVLRGEVNVRGITGALARTTVKRVRSILERRLPWSQSPARALTVGFLRALRRGGKVLMVFGAADGGLDVIEGLLGGGGGRLQKEKGFRLDIVEGPTHTFSHVGDQADLFRRVNDWIHAHWA